MKEFHINQYLSLRLKQDETIIYMAGEPFRQCKFLLLNIPITKISTFDEIESIDEAAEKVNETIEKEIKKIKISPEAEFWGHCSNLQVWYEHDYDTRLIHSNLAFPLLKKLSELGDPLAKRVFKTEIIKRYVNGVERTRDYLAAEGFLKYFTEDEKVDLLLDTADSIALIKIIEEIWPEKNPNNVILELIGEDRIKVENRKIVNLYLSNLGLIEFPKAILDLKKLEILSLRVNNIKEIPKEIKKLSSLKELCVGSNELSYIPSSLCEIMSLESLWFGGNKIHTLPENIGDLTHLKILRLENNQIKELPESFYKLRSLEQVNLSKNPISKKINIKKKLNNSKNIIIN